MGQDHERAFFDSADWALGKVRLLHSGLRTLVLFRT